MISRIDLRQMRYFLAVAETLHYCTSAAQQAAADGATEPQSSDPEDWTGAGTCALQQNNTGLTLTAAGAFLAQRAEDLQTSFDESLQPAQRIGKGEDGTLSVGFGGSAMYGQLPFVLDHFRRLYPKVQVNLREMYAHEQTPLLLNGSLDFGFISREPFHAVFPQSHKLAKVQGSLSLEN